MDGLFVGKLRWLGRLVAVGLSLSLVWGASPQAEAWMGHVRFLASDALQGRRAGSTGHRQAAEYVAEQFKQAGLRPLFEKSYLQPVSLRSRRVVREGTSVTVTPEKGSPVALGLGTDYGLLARNNLAPNVDAELVFIGYGLYLPEAKLNDTAGVDLKGKIAVYISGAPSGTKPVAMAHASASINRRPALAKAGAIGYISIPDPANSDVPWVRQVATFFEPAMNLTQPGMDDSQLLSFGMAMNPDKAGLLFEGSERKFTDLMRLVELGKPLPHFRLPWRLRASIKTETRELVSDNVAGVIPGTEPVFENEYVLVTGHLDHLGVAEAGSSAVVNGDAIYNGALDNAGGVAALIEIAKAISAKHTRRNVIIAAVTGEEAGLLGSQYLAAHNNLPRGAIIGNLNVDMFLPLHPFDALTAIGMGESTLKSNVERVAKKFDLKVQDDPQPKRVNFVRSDQYSFVRAGIPAVAVEIAPRRGTGDEKLQEKWISERYHSVQDDVNQPLDLEAAARFTEVAGAIARELGDSGLRPKWNPGSFFRRFEVK
jgi:Zn-dependent M28 family amino/carboxypeptidase